MTLGGTVGGLAGGETGADVLDRTSSSRRRRVDESTSAPHPLLSLVGGFESTCRPSFLRPTPVCEIMSRDDTFPTPSNALLPRRQISRLPDGMSCQTLNSLPKYFCVLLFGAARGQI